MANDAIFVDHESQKLLGRKMAIYKRVCNGYKCEDVEISQDSDAFGVSKTRLLVTGLAVTQRPRDPIYISKETFEKFGKNLIGKPVADGHGSFPWSAIKVDEMLGVVVDTWYDENREALMFKAEIWDEKAVEAMKRRVYVNFSVAYWYESELGKIINEYDEEVDAVMVTEMEFDHIAYLPNPQVPESEIQTIDEMQKHSAYACYSDAYMDESDALAKTYRHNSTIKDDEPTWGDVDKTRLPWNAFANWKSMDKQKKSTWKYPHHWVSMGKMYLHKGGLVYAIAAAKGARSGKRASPEIFSHLNSHMKKIKLSYEDFCNEVHDMWDVISDELGFNDVDEVIKDQNIVQMFGGNDMPEKDEIPAEDKLEEQKPKEEEVVEEQKLEETKPEEKKVEEPVEEEEEEQEEEEEKDKESDADSTPAPVNAEAFAGELASLMSEIQKRDKKIEELEGKVSAFETEKREASLLSKIDESIASKKILPKSKDDIFALLKGMTDEQVDGFFKVIEKNSTYPSGEKGKMGQKDSDAHEDENKDEKKQERFFT